MEHICPETDRIHRAAIKEDDMRSSLLATIGRTMLALSLLMTVPYVCKAQEYSNTPVTLSKEKVKVGGKMCWSHIVLEKQ